MTTESTPPKPRNRRYERLLALMHSVDGASLLVGVPGTAKVRKLIWAPIVLSPTWCLPPFELLFTATVYYKTNHHLPPPLPDRPPSSTSS
jgi:hypothetical protein